MLGALLFAGVDVALPGLGLEAKAAWAAAIVALMTPRWIVVPLPMRSAGMPPDAIVFASGYITVSQISRCGAVADLAGDVLVATVCRLVTPPAFRVR